MTAIDTARIRRELLDASEHLFRPNFVCCEGCRIAGTRVIELVEALEEARAEVERLRAIESPVRALQDRNGDVWVLDVHPLRYRPDRYRSPMPRDYIEKYYGPVTEVKS